MPKVSKKKSLAKAARKESVRGNQSVVAAAVVVAAVIVAPAAWYFTQSVLVLFLIPAVVSLVAAVMFKDVTGKVMSDEFRNETTTITAVFGIVLAVLVSMYGDRIGLDGKPDVVLPIFMILYRSLWAIIATLVAVYLPLGITIPKKK